MWAAILVDKIKTRIEQNPEFAKSAVSIIHYGYELVNTLMTECSAEEKRVILVQALQKIAAGDDHILGTTDDKIPEPLLKQLITLLETHMATHIIELLQTNNSGTSNANTSTKFCWCLPL